MSLKPVVDLFSGCGGMSLGIMNSGLELVRAYDNWRPAVSVYNDNFKHVSEERDLSESSVMKDIKQIAPYGIVGGPPCQDFSFAGKRNFSKASASDTRAALTVTFAKIVDKVNPAFFVMENVPAAIKAPSFVGAMKILEKNYSILVIVLDASLYGVPQKRKRMFAVGHRQTDPRIFSKWFEKRVSTETSVKDYFSKNNYTNPPKNYYLHPRTYARRAIFSSDEPAATIRGVNRPLPPTYKLLKQDSVDKITKDIRSLTFNERALIQTFPPTYNWGNCKSRSNLELMLGNSVPPRLAEVVGSFLVHIDK